jgi:hypothetical protein
MVKKKGRRPTSGEEMATALDRWDEEGGAQDVALSGVAVNHWVKIKNRKHPAMEQVTQHRRRLAANSFDFGRALRRGSRTGSGCGWGCVLRAASASIAYSSALVLFTISPPVTVETTVARQRCPARRPTD